MEEKNKQKLSADMLILITTAFTVVSMIAQCIAVLFGYDPSMKVFKHGTVVGGISAGVIFISAVIVSVIAFKIMKKGASDGIPKLDNLCAFLSAVSGTALICSSAIICFEAFSASVESGMTLDRHLEAVSMILLLVSVPAGLFYVLSALSDERFAKTKTALGFFPPLWGACSLMRIYFDSSSVINDPVRILFQVSIVFVMLAYLYELRIRVGKNGKTAFVITSLIAMVLGFSSALSEFMLYFITGTVTTGDLILSVCEVLVCLYLLVRSYAVAK